MKKYTIIPPNFLVDSYIHDGTIRYICFIKEWRNRNGSVSPYVAEELSEWMADLSEELVLKALQIAFENNKRTIADVKGIL